MHAEEAEDNPYRMGCTELSTTSPEAPQQPTGGVSTMSAALSSALATSAAGGVFGFSLLLLPWNSFFGAMFGGFFGIFIAGCTSLPTHLVVFLAVRLLRGPQLHRSVATIAASIAGGITGLLCTVWSVSDVTGVLIPLIATLLGAAFAGTAVFFLKDQANAEFDVTSEWHNLASED